MNTSHTSRQLWPGVFILRKGQHSFLFPRKHYNYRLECFPSKGDLIERCIQFLMR